MIKLKIAMLFLVTAFLSSSVLPALAATYDPGVSVGQYVKYGNFVGIGPGAEAFNDYDWLNLQVTDVSGKDVTLLSTSQFKNGTATAGNGTISVWNVETGTEDGVPSTQGPIIASNLNQGNQIPPPNTYTVNNTESRTYVGVSRTVNILDATLSTPDYNTSITYVYDKVSGMLLESTTQTATQADPQPIITTISYSIIETNIFSPNSSPTVPEFQSLTFVAIIFILIAVSTIITKKRMQRQRME